MDLSPTTEQEELLAWADELVTKELPIERFAGTEKPVAETALTTLAELGWIGLGLPEAVGGSALSIVDEMLLMAQAGKQLASPTLMATILAAHAAAESDPDLARAFIALEKRAAIAIPGETGNSFATSRSLLAFDADDADYLLLLDAESLMLVPANKAAATTIESVDGSLSLSRLDMPALATIPRHGAGDPLWLRAQLLVTALLVGAGEAALRMAVEYALVREQFGQPIGAFQAIKHKCADIAMQLTATRSQLSFASLAMSEGMSDAPFQILAARSLASPAAQAAAYGNVQIHGGMGFTSECHAQRFVKRITVLNLIGGTPKQHRAALLAGPEGIAERAAA